MSEFLVKMDTPNRCCDCPMCYDYMLCRLTGKTFGEIDCVELIADWCPIIKLHPHGRLIDADALFNNLERTGWYDNADRDIAEDLVLAAPTVIEAEDGE